MPLKTDGIQKMWELAANDVRARESGRFSMFDSDGDVGVRDGEYEQELFNSMVNDYYYIWTNYWDEQTEDKYSSASKALRDLEMHISDDIANNDIEPDARAGVGLVINNKNAGILFETRGSGESMIEDINRTIKQVKDIESRVDKFESSLRNSRDKN